MVQVPALTYGQVCENVEVINWTEKRAKFEFCKRHQRFSSPIFKIPTVFSFIGRVRLS
jgi:hypothetical protein